MSSSRSGCGGAARLAEGWGVSRGSVGVSVPCGPGVLFLIGVNVGSRDCPSGMAISMREEFDAEESRTWPPPSLGVWAGDFLME